MGKNDDKTEKPTAKRKQKARKKGQVATSTRGVELDRGPGRHHAPPRCSSAPAETRLTDLFARVANVMTAPESGRGRCRSSRPAWATCSSSSCPSPAASPSSGSSSTWPRPAGSSRCRPPRPSSTGSIRWPGSSGCSPPSRCGSWSSRPSRSASSSSSPTRSSSGWADKLVGTRAGGHGAGRHLRRLDHAGPGPRRRRRRPAPGLGRLRHPAPPAQQEPQDDQAGGEGGEPPVRG